ncbi:MAG: OmpA family protein [Pseudomonadota bacterium]
MPSATATRALLVFAALILSLPANAADGEGQVYITPAFDLVDDDKDRDVEDTTSVSLAVGYSYTERWSVEAFAHSASYSALGTANAQDHLEVGLNGLAVFHRDSLVSPYLLAGLSNLYKDFDSGNEDHLLNASVGAGVLFSTNDRFGFRLQYRHRAELGGTEFADNIYSLGLQFALGEPRNKIVDSDGDGVADMVDRCPNTAPGTMVDSTGCELDSDNDGVVDSIDECPSTPAGDRVDAKGCTVVLDSDNDGVADGADQCPRSPAGVTVDARGCEIDSDNDSVVDSKDQCPNTAGGVRVDVNGCEIKDVIRLPGVTFETNSDRLLPGAEQVLDDAAATLRKNDDLVVEVAGYTDSDGAAAYNESLSERRARTVRNYLVNGGANADNLTVRGYGEADPVADNTTAAGKAANRRVELRIQNQ